MAQRQSMIFLRLRGQQKETFISTLPIRKRLAWKFSGANSNRSTAFLTRLLRGKHPPPDWIIFSVKRWKNNLNKVLLVVVCLATPPLKPVTRLLFLLVWFRKFLSSGLESLSKKLPRRRSMNKFAPISLPENLPRWWSQQSKGELCNHACRNRLHL